MDRIASYIESQYPRWQEELFALLRIPSISPVAGFAQEVQRCARLFAETMERSGISVRVYETEGNPIVYGQTEQRPGLPTVLIYGHYDVQPEGDRSQWKSDPYEPEIRNGRIYARGVGDNKAQIFAHIKGYEAYRMLFGQPPVNIKYILEGEEEAGSVQLIRFAKEYAHMLRADITIWSDANVHVSGRPVVLCGLKGISSLKITVSGPCRDVHSQYSSVLPSPVWKLTKILASLKDEKGNVLIPGFYDGVQEPGKAEKDAISRIPGQVSDYTQQWQVDEVLHNVDMEQFYTRYMYEPTLNCGCIAAGDPEASKNIVPQKASAWLDIRTVPHQKHDKVIQRVTDYIYGLGISGVEVTGFGSDAAYTPIDDPFVGKAMEVLRQVWQKEPILYPALGGSGPYYVFNQIIGAPCIMIPYADARQNDHGPNESMPVELVKLGIRTSMELLQSFGRQDVS